MLIIKRKVASSPGSAAERVLSRTAPSGGVETGYVKWELETMRRWLFIKPDTSFADPTATNAEVDHEIVTESDPYALKGTVWGKEHGPSHVGSMEYTPLIPPECDPVGGDAAAIVKLNDHWHLHRHNHLPGHKQREPDVGSEMALVAHEGHQGQIEGADLSTPQPTVMTGMIEMMGMAINSLQQLFIPHGSVMFGGMHDRQTDLRTRLRECARRQGLTMSLRCRRLVETNADLSTAGLNTATQRAVMTESETEVYPLPRRARTFRELKQVVVGRLSGTSLLVRLILLIFVTIFMTGAVVRIYAVMKPRRTRHRCRERGARLALRRARSSPSLLTSAIPRHTQQLQAAGPIYVPAHPVKPRVAAARPAAPAPAPAALRAPAPIQLIAQPIYYMPAVYYMPPPPPPQPAMGWLPLPAMEHARKMEAYEKLMAEGWCSLLAYMAA
ncbi:unnamed protein product [Vitrella brassicaformis CCMP3155]|uniref:Uncharacterized protein n=1 Tax=Vitrella brassicaformis (strain CCMP3155) TaxID=1169540 RepID=A0A0G4GLV0_VITBC|nr:unnamed protein product [Vitrella brassicaformis CCMP3155]|eukprot:CEM31094.1 unnamed protein product [Vitrella brassicaformis CCMP3155]